MSFDWFADFEVKTQKSIDNCVKGENGFDKVKNIYSRIKLLATCLNKEDYIKNYAKSGEKIDDPKGHKLIIHRKKYNSLITQEIDKLKALQLYKSSTDITKLPPYSFFLQFPFALATPYLSKDDEDFYIIDNPVRKEKVFKVPMVSGSSWKGNLRWSAGKLLELANRHVQGAMRLQITKLFGNENEDERRYFDSLMAQDKVEDFEKEMKNWSTKGLRSGRLNFYPTFFNQIGLEVINPHDRKTKAGIQPIYIESVPEGATGTFSLLYVPFDLLGKPLDRVRKEVADDLRLICNSLREMMLTYGFSAKKSSGFGIVRDDFNIQNYPKRILNIKHDDIQPYKFKNFTELSNSFNEIIGLLEGKDGRE